MWSAGANETTTPLGREMGEGWASSLHILLFTFPSFSSLHNVVKPSPWLETAILLHVQNGSLRIFLILCTLIPTKKKVASVIWTADLPMAIEQTLRTSQLDHVDPLII